MNTSGDGVEQYTICGKLKVGTVSTVTNFKEVTTMTNYREVLRLQSLGLNHSQITESLCISRTTVIHTLQRATALEIDWRSANSMTYKELAEKLFPSATKATFKMPDYEYVHREMLSPA